MSISGLDIRYTYVTDITPLREWVKASLEWFPMESEKEIEDALQCWIGFSRWSASLTVTIDSKPCAIGTLFLMPYKKVAHHCLCKIIVDPKMRRKGVGFTLLKNLKHLARNYFHLEMIDIEVFEGNPILHLLKKSDFYEVVAQDNYVKINGANKARLFMEAKL
jgi:putative acetyltransferase